LDDRAFGWANRSGTIVRGFSVYHFEALTLGLQKRLNDFDVSDASHTNKLGEALEAIKKDEEFIRITTGWWAEFPGCTR
jgi:hypothetical protein